MYRIQGEVRDTETDQTLPNVNVFIDQTQRGTATNPKGKFEITSLKPGTYTLVASMIGYRMITVVITLPKFAKKNIIIGMTPEVSELPGIVVKANRPEKWHQNLETFKRVFLGNSPNGENSNIQNPEILSFTNKKDKLVTTTQHNPLILINKSLGYRTEFYLNKVVLENGTMSTYGFSKYSELEPENKKEKQKWQEQRKKTYLGSFRHFVRAVANHNLEKEGFKVFYAESKDNLQDLKLIEKVLKQKYADEKVYSAFDILATGYNAKRIKLVNPKSTYLGVIYQQKQPDKKSKKQETKILNQISLIELPADTAFVDINTGNFKYPYQPVLHGYWASSNRPPDLLPDDFDVSKFEKESTTPKFTFSAPDSLLPLNVVKSNNPEQILHKLESDYNLYRTKGGEWTDPRLGFKYIERITEKKLKSRYKKASEIYYWSLSNIPDTNFKDELAREVERLEPLVSEETLNHWDSLLEESNLKELGQSIKTFWELRDPAPSTSLNERLLEHWERLAYAKEHFRRSSSWAYGTDDRAKVYVAYGKPDTYGREQNSTHSGVSTAHQTFVNQLNNSVKTQLSDDPEINSPTSKGQLLGKVPYYSYQVWSYRNISPDFNDDIIFLFGLDGDTKEFRLLRSAEEMIPSEYLHYPNNPLPLQKSLYYSLGLQHPKFMRLYRDLIMLETNSTAPGRALAKLVRSNNRAELAHNRYQAPEEYSEYESALPDIPLKAYQYRMLNEQNEPVLATFIESNPQEGLIFDQVKERTFETSAYRLLHSVNIAEPGDGITFNETDRKSLELGYGSMEKMDPSLSYIELPNRVAGADQQFTAELHNKTKSSTDLSSRLFPETIRGLGRYTTKQPTPLSTDPSQLEVSDLIIGYDEESGTATNPFGFRIAPEGDIPQGQNIIVHFEVYHVQKSANAPARFKIDYLLEPQKNLLQRVLRTDDPNQVSLTLNFESGQSSYRDNLEISTSELDPGEYTLIFTVTEQATGQQKTRETTIIIGE